MRQRRFSLRSRGSRSEGGEPTGTRRSPHRSRQARARGRPAGSPCSIRVRCSDRTWARSRSYSSREASPLVEPPNQRPKAWAAVGAAAARSPLALAGKDFSTCSRPQMLLDRRWQSMRLLAAVEIVGAVLLQSQRRRGASGSRACRRTAPRYAAGLARSQRATPRSDGHTTGTGRKPSVVTAPPSVDRPDDPNSSTQHVGISTASSPPFAMICRLLPRCVTRATIRPAQRRLSARTSSSSSWRASSSSMIGMPSRIG